MVSLIFINCYTLSSKYQSKSITVRKPTALLKSETQILSIPVYKPMDFFSSKYQALTTAANLMRFVKLTLLSLLLISIKFCFHNKHNHLSSYIVQSVSTNPQYSRLFNSMFCLMFCLIFFLISMDCLDI